MNARLLCSVLGLVSVVLWAGSAAAQNSAEVAAYDRLLATVSPGQKTVALGDMLLPVETVRLWRDQLAGVRTSSATQAGVTKWTGGNVFYAFNANVSAAHRAHFLDAAADWATFANLTFTLRTSQPNYVQVNDGGPGLSGGNSAVGMIGGAQAFNIGSTSWNRATLVHELGHVLGLIHEHQRSDRDTFVTILTQNTFGGANDPNFIRLLTSNHNGPYDFLSVMHYARNTFSTDPATRNTIEPKPAFAQFLNVMGRSLHDRVLSRSDRQGIAAMYGAGPVLSPVVVNTRDAGVGSLRAAIYHASDLSADAPGSSPTITFAIPTSDPGFNGTVFTIRPTDRLQAPAARTILDATTQAVATGNTNASGPEVVLNGAAIDTPTNFGVGLQLADANGVVKGFVINGWSTHGVAITGTGNTISGCFIGTNAAGTAASANEFGGIDLSAGAAGNLIGGTTPAARNLISGQGAFGISIGGLGTNGNVVAGNFIGLNAAGTAALPNAFGGVHLFEGASGNTIGGTTASAGNVISGNAAYGVTIQDSGSTGNVVAGNFIGTNPAGTTAIGNSFAGVGILSAASGNVVGGTAAGSRNLISGNLAQGVLILGAGSDANVVAGNLIGLNATGGAAIPNAFAGVDLANGARDNLIGGTAAAARNVISGNSSQGVAISGSGTIGNRVSGNIIGANAAGTAAVANGFPGIEIFNAATGNTIGGAEPGAGNVISGNSFRGLSVIGLGTNGNVVAGNLIGLNAAGLAALPNAGPGVLIFDRAQGNTVGGTGGGRNFISGNNGEGITLIDAGTTGNLIRGNTIGLSVLGAAVPNTSSGVLLFNGPQNNTIGGPVPGAANLISGNTGSGVALFDAPTVGNVISGNSITANGGLAIDLAGGSGPGGGVTNNDSGDGDVGPNALQNYPVLTSAVLGVATTVAGTLNAAANTAFRVEFFANATADATGFGEAQHFAGAANVTTNASGNATINAVLPGIVPAGQRISATATSATGNTSELSANVVVTTTDTDGDGLPNAYETANGLNTAVNDAALDTDGDGSSNLAEFRAGTDPRSPASVLRPPLVSVAGGNVTLSLPTNPGRTYRIDYADDLAAPNHWRLFADQLPGTGLALPLTDLGAGTLPQRFYRALVLP